LVIGAIYSTSPSVAAEVLTVTTSIRRGGHREQRRRREDERGSARQIARRQHAVQTLMVRREQAKCSRYTERNLAAIQRIRSRRGL